MNINEDLRTQFYEHFLERLINPVRGILADEEIDRIRKFIHRHIFLPEEREARDQAFEILKDRFKSLKVMGFEQNLEKILQLIHLSNSLDESLVTILQENENDSPLGQGDIEKALISENRPKDRLQQTSLLIEILVFFKDFAAKPMAKSVMPLAKKAISKLNVPSMVDQIDEGYKMAREIEEFDQVLTAIQSAEIDYLESVYK